jgi:FDF domain
MFERKRKQKTSQYNSPSQNYRQQNNQGAPIPNNNQSKPNISGPQQQQVNPRINSKQLKFENEFDFEQANSKFEELRTQLSKLKVGAEETKAPEQVNWLDCFYYFCLPFGVLFFCVLLRKTKFEELKVFFHSWVSPSRIQANFDV